MCARIIAVLLTGILFGCGGGSGKDSGVIESKSCVYAVITRQRVGALKREYLAISERRLNNCAECSNKEKAIIEGLVMDEILKRNLFDAEYAKIKSNLYYLKSLIYLFEVQYPDLSTISCPQE